VDAALLAEQAFAFAYPLVVAGHATASPAVNGLAVTRARPDTLRVSGRLDLAEPLVLATPDTQGRYFVLWLRDAWNQVFASLGARTTGTGPRAFALLGPDHHTVDTAPELTRIAAPTRLVGTGGRIEAVAATDAELLEARPTVVPLSQWPRAVVGRDAAAPDAALPEMDAESFFAAFWALVADNPPRPVDRDALERLEAIAPRSGWSRLAPALRESLEAGVRRGREAVKAEAALPHGNDAGGWRVSYATGRYRTQYLRRAAMVHADFGADPAVDELVAVRDADEDGEPLTGRASYLLRFAPDRAPPVHGFWALTTCDAARPGSGWRSLSDLHGLRADTDGSLPISVRYQPPARRQRSNWLPAPPDTFRLELRLYWPRWEAVEARWAPPALIRVRS
jgi:hypothetical protein